jgi:hypothetical protein
MTISKCEFPKNGVKLRKSRKSDATVKTAPNLYNILIQNSKIGALCRVMMRTTFTLWRSEATESPPEQPRRMSEGTWPPDARATIAAHGC